MTYFAGLDVGLEETAICIIDSNGRIVRELKACSDPEALVHALRVLDVRYGRASRRARCRPGCSKAWRRPGCRSSVWRSVTSALPSRP